MGMEMWFKDDIRNILLSVNLSSAATARWANGDLADAYRLGYTQAIEVLAVAFGILPSTIRHHDERNPTPVQPSRSLG
jgi:hypothetical protein